MLYLIGLGLWDEKDLSLKALEILKKCDEIFVESYTSVWQGNLEALGIKAKKVGREEMEEGIKKILDLAKEKKVAILVPGDPLVATTHNSILIEAKKRGIDVEIIHNASIVSAIAELGLHIYKFGKIASISWHYSEYPYDILKQNKGIDAHTLFLLDTEPEPMNAKEGLKRLLEIEEKRKEDVVKENDLCIVACKLGSKNKKIYFGKIEDILKKDLREVPAIIVLPSKLHFSEEETLKVYTSISNGM